MHRRAVLELDGHRLIVHLHQEPNELHGSRVLLLPLPRAMSLNASTSSKPNGSVAISCACSHAFALSPRLLCSPRLLPLENPPPHKLVLAPTPFPRSVAKKLKGRLVAFRSCAFHSDPVVSQRWCEAGVAALVAMDDRSLYLLNPYPRAVVALVVPLHF